MGNLRLRVFLILNVALTVFSVIAYYTELLAYGVAVLPTTLISGIAGILFFLILLIHFSIRKYRDALLPGESILAVGEAPIWPVVLCSIAIAGSLITTILLFVLSIIPIAEDSLFVLLVSQLTLGYYSFVSLMVTVARILIAVLLLRPKMFLTNKRVIGHARRFLFSMYSSVPYSSITSVHVTCWHHVSIGTPAGNYHFHFVKNAPKIYKELLQMITAEQRSEEYPDEDFDELDDAFGYEMTYYAPAYYQHLAQQSMQPPHAPIPTPALGFESTGKPVVLQKPAKPRPPKFR